MTHAELDAMIDATQARMDALNARLDRAIANAKVVAVPPEPQ
jgi:hypothetical protein